MVFVILWIITLFMACFVGYLGGYFKGYDDGRYDGYIIFLKVSNDLKRDRIRKDRNK